VIPRCFLPHADAPLSIEINNGSDLSVEEIPFVNSYALQLESFSNSMLNNDSVFVTPEDSIANTRVIDAIRESNAVGRVVGIQPHTGV
jgi:predicted dehydrogenase